MFKAVSSGTLVEKDVHNAISNQISMQIKCIE